MYAIRSYYAGRLSSSCPAGSTTFKWLYANAASQHNRITSYNVCYTKLLRAAYIERLIVAGLDGIEASYSYDKTTYKGTLTPDQIEAEVRSQYTGRVRFISGGSDYHADAKKGAKKVRQIGEHGLTVDEFKLIFNQ